MGEGQKLPTRCRVVERPIVGQETRVKVLGLPLLWDMQQVPEGPSQCLVSFWHRAGFETNSLQALTLEWFARLTLAVWRQRQEEREFEAGLGCVVRPGLGALP